MKITSHTLLALVTLITTMNFSEIAVMKTNAQKIPQITPVKISQTTSLTQFRQEALQEHNRLRALHRVPPLTLDPTLNNYAQEWANNLAATGQFRHRSDRKYGENLYMTTASDVGGRTPVTVWYNEIKFYNFRNPGFSMETGHFTQVVWKSSTKLGCGKAKGAKGLYVVCNYNPPGNYIGQFLQNVLPLRQ